MTASGRLKVHYYRHRRGPDLLNNGGWWPAYTDVRDGADVLTLAPGPHLQPHCGMIFPTRILQAGLLGSTSSSPLEIATAQDFGKPTKKKELRSFLGLCSHFREHIEYFADVAQPLYDLLHGTTHLRHSWGAIHDNAFIKLKRLLTSAPSSPLESHNTATVQED
jgi:hypothetical protein